MAGFESCIGKVAAAGGGMSRQDAQQTLDIVDQRAGRLAREQGLGPDDARQEAVKQLTAEEAQAAAIERRNRLDNLRKRVALMDRVTAAGPDNLYDSIRAEVHGINTPRPGGLSRFSAQADREAIRDELFAQGVVPELDRAGLLKVASKGTLDEQIAQELFELSKGEEGEPGISGSEQARKIAEIWRRYQTLAKRYLNQAGASIGDYMGYVARTAHDPVRIKLAGYNKWRAVVLKSLDTERTFEGVEDQERFLRGVYSGLITGKHFVAGEPVGLKAAAFKGPGNLAKRLSQDRVLHWRDAKAWLEYQRSFGEASLNVALTRQMDTAARNIALMRRFGTNPRYEFAALRDRLTEKYRDSNPDAVIKLNDNWQALQNRFDHLDGTANIPENATFSRVMAAARGIEVLARLGNVLFTHLSAVMTRAAEFRHHGVGFLESYLNGVTSQLPEGEEGRELARQLGTIADGAIHDLTSQFDPSDGIPGRVSAWTGAFMRATGLTHFFDAWHGGFIRGLAYNAGRNIGKSYEQLSPELRAAFTAYGIDSGKWDLLRTAPDNLAYDRGTPHLTPKAGRNIEPEVAEAYLRSTGKLSADASHETIDRAVDELKQDLITGYNAYLSDSARRAMIMPGAEEKAILLGSTRPGSAHGEITRLMMQFKVWPTTLITQGLGREIYSSPDWKGAAIGLTHMAVAGMVFGYLRMVASDLSAGKRPRDPTSPRTMLAALAQGGGLGIFGDFLFGGENRFGQGPLETMAGPVIGDVAKLLEVWNSTKDYITGEKTHPGRETVRLLMSHIPFVNLFYTKLAWNYLIAWRIQEAMNPGSVRRFEQRTKRDTGQTYWLSPAQAVRAPMLSPGLAVQ